MARNTQYYSQVKNSVIIAAADQSWSRNLKDYFEGDDVIAWEPNAERVALTEGLDKSGISISSGSGGKVSVKLKPTSADVGALNKIYNLNRSEPQLLDVSIVTGVEEIVKLNNAAVNAVGSSSGGATMQARTFEFVGGELILDESEGS